MGHFQLPRILGFDPMIDRLKEPVIDASLMNTRDGLLEAGVYFGPNLRFNEALH